MNYLTKLTTCVLISCLPVMVNAANIPSVMNGAEKYTKEMCISNSTSDCIDSVCMNSTATDCPEQCRASARDKCRAVSE